MSPRFGRIVIISVLVLATVGAFGTVLWLKKLQAVAAGVAQTPCTIPDDRTCAADVDCVEVSCPSDCECNETCGQAISREALKKQHHVCLLPKMESRIPVACQSRNVCKCTRWSCTKQPACVEGQCQMVAAPDAGTTPKP